MAPAGRASQFWKNTTVVAPPVEVQYPCYDCGMNFKTHHSLAMHNFRVHDYVCPTQYRIAGPVCPVCLVYFGTRKRCLKHAVKNSTCNKVIMSWPEQLSIEEVIRLKNEDNCVVRHNDINGLHQQHAENLCVLARGPVAHGFSSYFHSCRRRYQLQSVDSGVPDFH